MKIALISPKGRILGKHPKFREFWQSSQSVQSYKRFWSGLSSGLLVLGALTPKNIKVELIDENVEDIDFSKGYDLVALSAMTQQATRAYAIADEFRKRRAKVVMGGIHATVLPKEAKGHCDSVVVGEAEDVWSKLLKDFSKNKGLKVKYAGLKKRLSQRPSLTENGLLMERKRLFDELLQ